MKSATALAVIAEHAVARGAPLQQSLAGARAVTSRCRRRVDDAIAAAGSHDLPTALSLLGVDPLVSAAAQIDPSAVAEIGRRLRRLPSPADVDAETVRPALMAVGISTSILFLTGSFVVLKVLAVFTAIYRQHHAALPAPAQIELDLVRVAPDPGWIIGTVIVAAFLWRRGAPRRWSDLSAARVCVAAAPLLARGKRAEEVLPALFRAASLHARWANVLEDAPLDPAELLRLGDSFVLEARKRAARWASAVRVVGNATNLLLALSLAWVTYLSIAGVPWLTRMW